MPCWAQCLSALKEHMISQSQKVRSKFPSRNTRAACLPEQTLRSSNAGWPRLHFSLGNSVFYTGFSTTTTDFLYFSLQISACLLFNNLVLVNKYQYVGKCVSYLDGHGRCPFDGLLRLFHLRDMSDHVIR